MSSQQASDPVGNHASSPSLLQGLTPFAWSTETSVRYEVALEMLAQEAAACTAVLERERAGQAPNAGKIEALSSRRAELARQQQQLDPHDVTTIEAILANAADQIHAING